jgi:hypothetical protein
MLCFRYVLLEVPVEVRAGGTDIKLNLLPLTAFIYFEEPKNWLTICRYSAPPICATLL